MSSWHKTRVQISQLADLSTATHGYPSSLHELSRLVDGNDIGELSTADINNHAASVKELLDQIPHALTVSSWAHASLSPAVSSSREGSDLLLETFRAFATAPDEELTYRHPAH
jgi:hypothetical protein